MVDHILYVDPNEPVCEDSIKMVQGFANVHVVNVKAVSRSEIPECVTFLPTLIDIRGKGRHFPGSKCTQYLKHMFKPKSTDLKFMDPNKPVSQMLRLDIEDVEKQTPIDVVDQQSTDLFNIPNYGSDFKKAMARSDAHIAKMENKLKYQPQKPPEPISERDVYKDQNLMSRVDSEVNNIRARAQNPAVPMGGGGQIVQEIP